MILEHIKNEIVFPVRFDPCGKTLNAGRFQRSVMGVEKAEVPGVGCPVSDRVPPGRRKRQFRELQEGTSWQAASTK